MGPDMSQKDSLTVSKIIRGREREKLEPERTRKRRVPLFLACLPPGLEEKATLVSGEVKQGGLRR